MHYAAATSAMSTRPRQPGHAGHAGRLCRSGPGTRRVPARHRISCARCPPLISEGAENGPVPTPPISELVHEGQEIVVQVVKDPDRQQGRAPDHAFVDTVALSGVAAVRKDDRCIGAHRGRGRTRAPEGTIELQALAVSRRPAASGYIVRTNAERPDARSAGRGCRLPRPGLAVDAAKYRPRRGRRARLRGFVAAAARAARPDARTKSRKCAWIRARPSSAR